MPEVDDKSSGAPMRQPPSSSTGHPLPRRTSPANSVTLRHHRLARDASLRASLADSGPNVPTTSTSSPRRNSSGESQVTGHSDPNHWFDQSNQNPTATFDNNVMDVDPPFFQKESDSSNEEKAYAYPRPAVPPRLTAAQSSSADDYRSVIDDLTVEIQKLKEELKRYKQKGPDMLKREKLFEIKIHGLPKRKKRELETALRDFTAGLENTPDTSSSQRQKSSRQSARDNMYSTSGSRSRDHTYFGAGPMSKHASSSSGSHARPVDSAYASMSTGAHSAGRSLGHPSASSRAKSSEQKVENYLRDIPAGLYPRHMAMTEKEKKRLVVRRLEQLFTGKISGCAVPQRDPFMPHAGQGTTNLTVAEAQVLQPQQTRSMVHLPPSLSTMEQAREAKISPAEQQPSRLAKKSTSRDNGSASHSGGDLTEAGGNGNSGSGTNPSPPSVELPEQRPTRPKDLDPDRVQVPSENMEYIRHLGLVPPELLSESSSTSADVHPDADGWVYLNLLCSLAQLHIINVTPDFVRLAVSNMSTKFQLSPDGRKIRWRGGTEGTKFSSDSSGANSQRSPETEDSDGSNKDDQRKRRKTGNSVGDEVQSGSSGKDRTKFGPQVSAPSKSFHYKPLLVRQDLSYGDTSVAGTTSSYGPVDDSHVESRWDQSGSGTSPRRKRRHDGAIIYYSGAPFCTDLSGDPGEMSPTTYMLSSGQTSRDEPSAFARPPPRRSESGSLLPYRPLCESTGFGSNMDFDDNTPGLTTDSGGDSSELEFEPPWSHNQQYMEVRPLDPCGLGGVLPDDHFMVVVTTKRPKQEAKQSLPTVASSNRSEEVTKRIIRRLTTVSASSPTELNTHSKSDSPAVEIEYLSGRIKRLAPVSLPPPAIFYPPFTNDSSSAGDDDFGSEEDSDELPTSAKFNASRLANPHRSDGYPDGVDLTSGDEDGEDPEDEFDARRMCERKNENAAQVLPNRRREDKPQSFSSADVAPGTARGSKSVSVEMMVRDGSSAATAGGVKSGYSSSNETS